MPPATPATSQPRPQSRSTQQQPSTVGRVTRLRAGKETSASPALGRKPPSGLLAKGKEGLRKVSDKIKEKENQKPRVVPVVESNSYSESLQVILIR